MKHRSAALLLAGAAVLSTGSIVISWLHENGLAPHANLVLSATTVDFGPIDVGNTVTQTLSVANRGKEVLHVKDIVASCGCTQTEIGKSTLEPGEETSLAVVFNSKGFTRQFHKVIQIVSNDPEKPMQPVHIKGYVRIGVRPESEFLYLGRLQPDEESAGQLSLIRDTAVQTGDIRVTGETDDLTATPGEWTPCDGFDRCLILFHLKATAAAGSYGKNVRVQVGSQYTFPIELRYEIATLVKSQRSCVQISASQSNLASTQIDLSWATSGEKPEFQSVLSLHGKCKGDVSKAGDSSCCVQVVPVWENVQKPEDFDILRISYTAGKRTETLAIPVSLSWR